MFPLWNKNEKKNDFHRTRNERNFIFLKRDILWKNYFGFAVLLLAFWSSLLCTPLYNDIMANTGWTQETVLKLRHLKFEYKLFEQ